MAKRISLFSKEFADSEGNSPKNALVIELLAKHGVEGKTASSNISAEEEALIEGDLKAKGYKKSGDAAEAPAKVPEKKPETVEKKEEPAVEAAVKAAPAKDAAVQEKPAIEKPAQEAVKTAPATSSQCDP